MDLYKSLKNVANQSALLIASRKEQERLDKERQQYNAVHEAGQAQKQDWLDAARADNVLLYMESGQPCQEALNRCSGTLTVACLCLLLSNEPESNPDVRIMRGAQSAVQQAITHYAATPDTAMVTSISIAMERAMTAIENVHPIVFMKVLHTLEQYRSSVADKKKLNS